MGPCGSTQGLRFRSGSAWLILAACGWALASAGCSSNPSLPLADAGSGGKKGTGGAAAGTGGGAGAGAGGMIGGSGGSMTGSTGGTGVGGAAAGGAAGTDAGGATDAGTGDAIVTVNVCADAGNDGGTGDFDLDSVPDCLDGCPMDFYKVAPGVCGCGVPDYDTDGDGVPDCLDKCPGAPDVDSDGDGVIDCLDGCPQDRTRTTAGVCGCGAIPDSTPLCLVHRYSFDDTTATIADSITIAGISPANGTAMGTVPASGRITLAGGASTQIGGQYVTLPPGTISTLGNSATFEAWVTWNPVVPATAGAWQRIFDFGNSDATTANTPGLGQTYIFLSPSNGATNLLRGAMTIASNGAGGEELTDGTGALPTNTTLPIHVALVVDAAHKLMTLYVNGVANGTPVALSNPADTLSAVKDVNNWLGRSQWAADPLFAGAIYEFRIYSAALTAAQISANAGAGPDSVAPPVAADGGTSSPDGGAGADAGAADGPAGDVPAGG